MNYIEQSTKEKILATSLQMFATDGYTAVSVRNISNAVGIKESSIYYHFRNKEDIFQTILSQAEELMQMKKEIFINALHSVSRIECEKFIDTGIAYVENYLLEDNVHQLIQMLTIEKQRNKEAASVYHKLLFTAPLEHHKNIFAYMMDKEYIIADNPEFLAAEYQAIILFIFHKYYSDPDFVSDAIKSKARQELSFLLKRFYNRYFSREAQ